MTIEEKILQFKKEHGNGIVMQLDDKEWIEMCMKLGNAGFSMNYLGLDFVKKQTPI